MEALDTAIRISFKSPESDLWEPPVVVADEEEAALHQAQEEMAGVFLEEESRLSDSEGTLQDLIEQEDRLGLQLEQARQKLYQLLADLTRMSSQQEEADRRLNVLAELVERNRQEAITVTGQLENLKDSSGKLTLALESIAKDRQSMGEKRQQLQGRQTEIKEQMEHLEAELLERREEFSHQRSRLESLEQL